MMPDKYTSLGFDIAKFGTSSRAIRFDGKPVFVFSSESDIKDDFIALICQTYLNTHYRQPAKVEIPA
jgi:hypothetical protein